MKKYACSVCGYIYDEAKGIPEAGIEPGTRWEDYRQIGNVRFAALPNLSFGRLESLPDRRRQLISWMLPPT